MEEWRDIPGYEGRYRVSNLGRVASLLWGDGGFLILKQNTHRKGHRYVHLWHKNGRRLKLYVHRLVAMAFLPGFDPTEVVNHINGDKKRNRADNLEWTSSGDNTRHYLHGLRRMEELNEAF